MSERWLTALAAHGLPGAPELGPVPGDLEPMHRDVRHHRLAGVWAVENVLSGFVSAAA